MKIRGTNSEVYLFIASWVLIQLALLSYLVTEGSVGNKQVLSRPNNVSDRELERIGELPTGEGKYLARIQFISENLGWIYSADKLWKTENGGLSWNLISEREKDTDDSIIYFFNNGRSGWRYATGKVQKTEDGGYTWTAVTLPVKHEKTGINAISFLNDNKRGWIAGGEAHPFTPSDVYDPAVPKHDLRGYYLSVGKAPSGIILFTDDAGKNWRRQFVPLILGSAIDKLYISNQQQVWAIGQNRLYHLEGGRWQNVDFTKGRCANNLLLEAVGIISTPFDPSDIIDVCFVNSNHGWILLSNGLLARSIDGGYTWCDLLDYRDSQRKSDEDSFKEIDFIDPERGWGLSNSGRIYRTNDGGMTWVKIQSDVKFFDILFLNIHDGWAIGEDGLYRIKF